MTSSEYQTSDLALAAALEACGLDLVRIEKANHRKVIFFYADADLAQKIVDEYWNDRLRINARSYFMCVKKLKDRLYAEMV